MAAHSTSRSGADETFVEGQERYGALLDGLFYIIYFVGTACAAAAVLFGLGFLALKLAKPRKRKAISGILFIAPKQLIQWREVEFLDRVMIPVSVLREPRVGFQPPALVLRQLLGPQDDADALVTMARTRAARVVVKRPHRAAPLVPGVDFEIATKLVRFDVYLNPGVMSEKAS